MEASTLHTTNISEDSACRELKRSVIVGSANPEGLAFVSV